MGAPFFFHSIDRRPTRLVAFTGQPGAGRASCAAALGQAGYVVVGFDDALRREVSEAWRVDARHLRDHGADAPPVRDALAAGRCGSAGFVRWIHDGGDCLRRPRSAGWVLSQWAAFRRRDNPAYFTDIVRRQIQNHAQAGARGVAVADLTRLVELQALRTAGLPMTVVRVSRPELRRCVQQDQLPVDAFIVNSGSLADLAMAAADVAAVDSAASGAPAGTAPSEFAHG